MVDNYVATPTQLQLVSMFQAAPAEVRDAVEIFREQLINKQEQDAINDFINIKKPKLDVDQLTQGGDNQMYMSLLTNAFVTGDTEAFAYYSRFFVLHLHWNMVRLPDKSGSSIFEEKDIDKRLQGIDFHIETDENKKAFQAFLEFI